MAKILDDYEGRNLSSEYTTTTDAAASDFFVTDTRSFSGNYSVKLDKDSFGSYTTAANFRPTELKPNSGGKKADFIEFYCQEIKSSFGGAVTVENASGSLVAGFVVNNPQWEVLDGAGNENFTQVFGGNGYDRWIRVKMSFDYTNDEVSYNIEDLQTNDEVTQTFPMETASDNVAEIDFHPYSGSSFGSDSSIMWFDSVQIDGADTIRETFNSSTSNGDLIFNSLPTKNINQVRRGTGDRTYVVSDTGEIYGINEDGQKEWLRVTDRTENITDITYGDGVVYANTITDSRSYIEGYDVNTKNKVLDKKVEYDDGSFIVSGDVTSLDYFNDGLYIGASFDLLEYDITNDSFNLLNEEPGTENIQSIYSDISGIYLASGGTYKLDYAGNVVWSDSTDTASVGAGSENVALAETGTVNVKLLDKNGGTVKWSKSLPSGNRIKPVEVNDNAVFVANDTGSIYALDKSDGSILMNSSRNDGGTDTYMSLYTSTAVVVGDDRTIYGYNSSGTLTGKTVNIVTDIKLGLTTPPQSSFSSNIKTEIIDSLKNADSSEIQTGAILDGGSVVLSDDILTRDGVNRTKALFAAEKSDTTVSDDIDEYQVKDSNGNILWTTNLTVDGGQDIILTVEFVSL